MRPMTEAERALAEECLRYVGPALRGVKRAYPGIARQLDRIDAVAVAQLAVCRATQTYDPAKSKPSTYFSMAIRNAVLKEVSKRRRLVMDGRDRIPLTEADALVNRPPDTVVAIAIAWLPKDSLHLIRLRYWEGKNLTEIAAELGCGRAAVRRRLTKATSHLRTALEIHARRRQAPG